MLAKGACVHVNTFFFFPEEDGQCPGAAGFVVGTEFSPLQEQPVLSAAESSLWFLLHKKENQQNPQAPK